MSKVEGYGVYQSSYYTNTAKSRASKESDKADKTDKTGRKDPVQLSDKAKKLLEELKKTYGNMDFIIADYETDEEASEYLSRGTKEYSVLMDPETLEEMAADESAKAKYTGILDDAVGQLDNIREKLGDKKDEVARLGISIGKDGSVSYFAELEKIGERQKEWIEKSREDRKEQRTEQEKKIQENAMNERTKKTKVQADSVEELLEKIKAVDWDQVKEEQVPVTGGRFDFSV